MTRDFPLNRRLAIQTGTAGAAAALGMAPAALVAEGQLSDSADGGRKSIRQFGVDPAAGAAKNRKHLQEAIDWATTSAGVLWVEPSEEPYRVESGLRLRKNVSLLGAHGPVPRGTRHPTRPQPVGSVFAIESTDQPFITVESATQLRGLQFWYPNQTRTDPAKIIDYPVTVQRAMDDAVWGVTFSSLTFFGETTTFDFRAPPTGQGGPLLPSELILFEHCYGYPLGGRFIDIDYCYDIPRILHCHVNPAVCRLLANQDNSPEIIQSVVDRGKFSYAIDHTDNAQLMDLFTFGVYGGARLGAETYGQLTNFNFDCVTIGIHKSGSQQRNRNWQIAQGSIIANTGPQTADLHPLVIDGQGHTSLTNIESFAGKNPVVHSPTADLDGERLILSEDFLQVGGSDPLTVALLGCRMSTFRAKNPITILNPAATVSTHGCFEASNPWKPAIPYPDGVVTG